MSSYLHGGWHEFFLPVRARTGCTHLRLWIDMEDVLPMLRRLDQIYGDADHPYATRVEEIPDAQRKLLELVAEHIIHHPETVRRAAAPRQFFAELRERFGVERSDYPLEYPPAIDQVDVDPSQTMFALPFLLDRDALSVGNSAS